MLTPEPSPLHASTSQAQLSPSWHCDGSTPGVVPQELCTGLFVAAVALMSRVI